MKSQSSFEKKQTLVDKATERFNKNMRNMKSSAAQGASGLSSLAGKMGGLISLAYLGKKAFDAMVASIKIAATQQVQKNTFNALAGSTQAGSALYSYVSEYAKTSALGREDLASATTSFLPYTKDINQIEKLIKLTERLYAKDPSQGADGAVFAIKELLSGDTMSVKDRFNMSGISGAKIRDLANSGDMEGMIEYVTGEFDRLGASQAVVDANFDSLMNQANMFASNMQSAVGDAATPVMETLSGVMKRLNDDMAAGKFQPFINLMVSGMEMIGNGITWVVENLNWLAPVVLGAATAFVVYKGVLLAVEAASKAAAFATSLLNMITGATTMNITQLIAGIAGLGVGGALAFGAFDGMNQQMDTANKSLAQLKEEAGASLGNAKMPVEITNSDPISVKGEVDIEQESLRYMLDVAGMKYMAKFSTATLAPQVNMYGTQIQQVTDLNEVTDVLAGQLVDMTGTEPAGVY